MDFIQQMNGSHNFLNLFRNCEDSCLGKGVSFCSTHDSPGSPLQNGLLNSSPSLASSSALRNIPCPLACMATSEMRTGENVLLSSFIAFTTCFYGHLVLQHLEYSLEFDQTWALAGQPSSQFPM